MSTSRKHMVNKRMENRAFKLKKRLYDALIEGGEICDKAQFSANDIADLLLWEERNIWQKVLQVVADFKHYPTVLSGGQEAMNELKSALRTHLDNEYWKDER